MQVKIVVITSRIVSPTIEYIEIAVKFHFITTVLSVVLFVVNLDYTNKDGNSHDGFIQLDCNTRNRNSTFKRSYNQ